MPFYLPVVINYDLPYPADEYVHRIGRTARAGREGLAITFVTQREMGKFNRIQKDLGERIDRMPVPNDADILAYQRQSLIDELDEAMDASGSEHAEAWLEEILESSGWSAPDVAAAALAMLALERNFDLRASNRPSKAPEERDRGSSDRGEKTEEDFAHLNQVELFFAAGRRDGLRPADFVGALCNEADLPSSSIGRITMGGHKSFVGLPRRVADHLLRERATLEIRGTTHPLRLSNQSQDQSAGIDSSSSNSNDRGNRSSKREDGDTFRRHPSKGRSPKKHHKKGKSNKNKGKRKHHRNNDKK